MPSHSLPADQAAVEEREKEIDSIAKLLVKAKPGTTLEQAKRMVREKLYAEEEEEENGESV